MRRTHHAAPRSAAVSALILGLTLTASACTSDPEPGGAAADTSITRNSAFKSAEEESLLDAGFEPLDTTGCPPAMSFEELQLQAHEAIDSGASLDHCAAAIGAGSFLASSTERTDEVPRLFLLSTAASSHRLNELAVDTGQGPIANGSLANQDITVLVVRALDGVFVPGRGGQGSSRLVDAAALFAAGQSAETTAMMVLPSDSPIYSGLVDFAQR